MELAHEHRLTIFIDYEKQASQVSQADAAAVKVSCKHRPWLAATAEDAPAMQLTCTPAHLDELVVGHLLTEGIITSVQDIISIDIDEPGLAAKVVLSEGAAAQLHFSAVQDVRTSCTNNCIVSSEPLRNEMEILSKENPVSKSYMYSETLVQTPQIAPIRWTETQLHTLSRCINDNAPLYERTHAVHSCFLGCGDEILCGREDLGRHNTVDKVIGWAALTGHDLTKCIMFITGRMPTDMVTKVIRSRIPVLASKTYPTAESVELAKLHGLTLVTLSGRGDMVVWTR